MWSKDQVLFENPKSLCVVTKTSDIIKNVWALLPLRISDDAIDYMKESQVLEGRVVLHAIHSILNLKYVYWAHTAC